MHCEVYRDNLSLMVFFYSSRRDKGQMQFSCFKSNGTIDKGDKLFHMRFANI